MLPITLRGAQALVTVSSLALVLGCARAPQSDGVAGVNTHPEAETALVDALVNRQAIINVIGDGPSVSDLFPADGTSAVLKDAFRAEVVDVEPGRAFGGSLDDEPGQVELSSFDDPTADWRTFHVEVQVLEVFAGQVKPSQFVTLVLAFGSGLDSAIVEDGFVSMGQVVAFTTFGDFGVPYDRSLVPVLNDSAFLSPVEDGAVPFPALQDAGAGEVALAARLDTLNELRAIAAQTVATPS